MATSLPPEATISVLSLAPISRDQVAPFLSSGYRTSQLRHVFHLELNFVQLVAITGRTATTDSVQSGLPWTISNKYYTADVAFQMVHSVSSIHEDVPAVLIVVTRTSVSCSDVGPQKPHAHHDDYLTASKHRCRVHLESMRFATSRLRRGSARDSANGGRIIACR